MDAFFPLDLDFMVYFIIWEMYVFSHYFPLTWEKTTKPIEWRKPGKLVPRDILQNTLYVENLRNWYSYLSLIIGAFFPLDSHSMVYFIICEIDGFSHEFPKAWENAVKPIELGEARNWYPFFP